MAAKKFLVFYVEKEKCMSDGHVLRIFLMNDGENRDDLQLLWESVLFYNNKAWI